MHLLFFSVSVQALPDVQPGALPALQKLVLQLPGQAQPLALPASWGATPGTLPALRQLTLSWLPVVHPLPAAWARGFRRLESLAIEGAWEEPGPRAAPAAPAAPPAEAAAGGAGSAAGAGAASSGSLPAAWARGFPRLASLTLRHLGLTGTLPASWLAPGSFPALSKL